MIKEIGNIYAIIPYKEGMTTLKDVDKTNKFGKNNYNILFLYGKERPQNNIFGNNCNNLVITDRLFDLSTFKNKLKFCWKILFNY
jgi:hypothetical protein